MKMQKMRLKQLDSPLWVTLGCLACAAMSILILTGSACAFEIPTGNDDLNLRWDNTIRLTVSQRLKSQNKDILNSPQNDDGDRNFDKGIVSNRLDILSEIDLVYKRLYGIRLSGAGWWDPRYGDLDNNSPTTSNHLENGMPAVGLDEYTEDRFEGPNAELLDAFAFAGFDFGGVPVDIRLGRHTVIWGESMFSYGGVNGIAYAQSPIDIAKSLAQPGIEVKELYRPLNQISGQIQATTTLTFGGQYYFQWEPNIFPESGTYLGYADALLNGAESIWTGAPAFVGGPIRFAGDIEPDQAGDWGVFVRWKPELLDDGILGLYYRNFSDKMPQDLLDVSKASPTTMPEYYLAYPSDIELYGISLSKGIFGISVGAEISYRKNMPLRSMTGVPVGIPGSPVPGKGDTAGARGDTLHGLINFLGVIPHTALFDSATWITEFTFSQWQDVTQGEQYFLGRDGYTGTDRVTKNNITGALIFIPKWYQVFPSVDLSMPLSISSGLIGASSVGGGGVENNGNYSAGLSFDIFARYTLDITYTGFFGEYNTDASGQIPGPGLSAPGEETGAADSFALLKDRDLLTLTFKVAF